MTEDEILKLAYERLNQFFEEKLSIPVRIDPWTGDMLEKEKVQLLAQLRAIGIPAESVTYNQITKGIEIWPRHMVVEAEVIIRNTESLLL